MAKQYKCKQSPCSILQPSWFSLNPVIAKYPNLSKIPMRITQNMRTCAKSRENYAKYANLGKIPWELIKIRKLLQNPARIMRIYAKYANHIRESFRVHTQTISRTYAKYANHFAYIRKLFRVNTRNTRTISCTYANHFAYIPEPFRVWFAYLRKPVRVHTRNLREINWCHGGKVLHI